MPSNFRSENYKKSLTVSISGLKNLVKTQFTTKHFLGYFGVFYLNSNNEVEMKTKFGSLKP